MHRHAKSVIPPACTALGHLQTTVRPVPPCPVCMRVAASPAAHRASSSRKASAKPATHPARAAPAPPRQTAPPAPRWPPSRMATAGRAARRSISSAQLLESASGAVQTVSAAQQTSKQALAVFVYGVRRRGPGCWVITVSPTAPREPLACMEHVSNAMHHVIRAVGPDLSPALPALPTVFCCHLVFVFPSVLLVTMMMVTGSVSHVTASA